MSDQLSMYRNALNKVKQIEVKDALPATTSDVVVDVVLLNGLLLVEGITNPEATFVSMGVAALEGAAAGVVYNLIRNALRK